MSKGQTNIILYVGLYVARGPALHAHKKRASFNSDFQIISRQLCATWHLRYPFVLNAHDEQSLLFSNTDASK